MKLEKEVYINKAKGIYNKDTDKIFYTLEIVFCDLLTEEEISKLSKLTNKTKLTLEVEGPILDEKERKYLSGVIRPFKNEIECIIKKKSCDFIDKEYIIIHFEEWETMPFKTTRWGWNY